MGKIRKNCQQCGRFYWVYPYRSGKAKYCSLKCVSNEQKDRVLVKCKGCGRKFDIPRSFLSYGKGKYCSKKCESNYKTDKRSCDNCGETFYVERSIDKKFCTQKCHYEYRTIYPETGSLRIKIRQRKRVENLEDNYVKGRINQYYNIRFGDIPQELIELKRLNIKRKRIIRNHNKK